MITKEPKKVVLIDSSTKDVSESETAEMVRLRRENELLQEKIKSLTDPWSYRKAGLEALKENRVLEALGWFEKALVSDSSVISDDDIKKLPVRIDLKAGLIRRVITDVDKIPEIQKRYSEFEINFVIQGAVCFTAGGYFMHDEIRELSALSDVQQFLCRGMHSILTVCAFLGYENFLRLLVDHGADVNLIGKDGQTTLMAAGMGGHFGILKYLIEEKKMEIHQLDRFKRNVLFYAADGGNLLIVKYLIDEKGMDIGQEDSFQQTILFFAAQNGSISMVKYLVEEKGMDTHQRNRRNDTVLDHAMFSRSLSMVKYLVEERGMATNPRDKHSEKLLSFAVHYGSLPVVKYLVDENGMDINELKNMMQTLLFIAVECGVFPIVKYFVEQKGMNVHVIDEDGMNLLCYCDRLSIIAYLLGQGLRLTPEQRKVINRDRLKLIEKEEKAYGDKVGEQQNRVSNDADEKSEDENNEVPTVRSVKSESELEMGSERNNSRFF